MRTDSDLDADLDVSRPSKKMGEEELEVVETGDGEDFGTRDVAAALKKAKHELSECRKKAEEYLDGWQRAKADFINRRKDEEKEREAMAKFANEKLVKDVLNILDSLEMAARAGDSGVANIHRQLAQILKGYGVEELSAVGAAFNPAEHEAMLEEAVEDESKDGMVLEELQKGYRMRDKVIRAAKVKVGVYQKSK
ncbi:MAG: nucleotide exchange factor GrpE [Candidatus Niyogibacteria bacterium]|nr:nucleotide exchange factor GrpE [Candidatus Niyogibacteria bacterium]